MLYHQRLDLWVVNLWLSCFRRPPGAGEADGDEGTSDGLGGFAELVGTFLLEVALVDVVARVDLEQARVELHGGQVVKPLAADGGVLLPQVTHHVAPQTGIDRAGTSMTTNMTIRSTH